MIYVTIAFRIVTIMALLLFLTLRTGRRKIGELPVYDFLSVIVIGSVIGADITEPDIPHLPIAFAVIFIVAVQYFVSNVLINNKKIAKKITFGPTVVIQDGQFIKSNLERLKYSVENILMALREKDVFDLNEVAFAIVEGSGKLSVLKKTQFLPVTPPDVNLNKPEKGLSIPLIIDGKTIEENLEKLKRDRDWLATQLERNGIRELEEVFYAHINSDGTICVSKVFQAQDVDKGFTL